MPAEMEQLFKKRDLAAGAASPNQREASDATAAQAGSATFPAAPAAPNLLEDVRRFLDSLRRELPDIFSAPNAYPRSAPPKAPPAAADSSDREKAREILAARTEHWSQAIGVRYNRIRIKDQSSLWGSCSVGKNLNFNWRLIMAPDPVLDYVVIHELCHLREMNHSPRFWKHVAAWCPEYKTHRRWLREESHRLR